MSHNKVTRKRSKIGAPSTQIPIMVYPLGGQSLRQTPNSQNLNVPFENNVLYYYNMKKSNLEKLTKDQLITLLLAKQKPVSKPRTKKMVPISKPRQSVKQMVKDYENTIIKPPMQFRDRPIVQPRNNIIPPPKQFADTPVPKPRMKKVTPIPKPRTQITQLRSPFHKYTNSYEIGIKNVADPLVQLSETRLAI